jgi:tetratricopeptide (TPR) repeat protein
MLTRLKTAVNKLLSRRHGDEYNLSGDFRGATVNIKTRVVWIGVGLIAIAVAFVIGSVAFNVGPLVALLPTPTPSPTPLAFPPAIEGQSLIIVADFEDRSGGRYRGIDPAQYIFEQMTAQARQDQLNVRIERLQQALNDNSVKAAGYAYSATLVVWGWYDALTITPRLERLKVRPGYSSVEETLHLSLADPAQVEVAIVANLPSHTAYLVFLTLGLDEYAAGNDKSASRLFEQALAAVDNTDARVKTGEAHFYLGNVHSRNRELRAAIDDYTQVVLMLPDKAAAYYNRGTAYWHLQEYESAIKDFDQALQLNPDWYQAYTNRGNAYASLGKHAQAIQDYNHALQIEPDDAPSYFSRGNSYQDQHEYELALADYRKALQLDPGMSGVYVELCRLLSVTNRYQEAIPNCSQALRYLPDMAELYVTRGWAYVNTNEVERALADLNQAIRLDPKLAMAYALRGVIYKDSGETAKAIADFQQVLALSYDPQLRQQAEEHLKSLGAQ